MSRFPSPPHRPRRSRRALLAAAGGAADVKFEVDEEKDVLFASNRFRG